MAEVSNLHRFHQQTTVTSVEAFNFGSHSPGNPCFLRDSSSVSDNEAFHVASVEEADYVSQGFESVHSDPNFFIYDQGDDEEQMNFVTDLFESHRALTDSPDHSDFLFGSMLTGEGPELELGLGLESEFDRVLVPSMGGLRVVNMDSESDSEAVEVDSGVDCINNHEELVPNCEWEEVNERENLSSVIDQIEEISVSSHGEIFHMDSEAEEGEEENVRNLEWQVLLAVHDLELDTGFDNNAHVGEFIDVESSVKGSPPAAKSVVENLPLVVLTTEDLKMNNVICAVCKDDISVGEEATKLPCSHHFHGDCIVPWLSIRNTCPVCRNELPTDDADYEKRKNGRRDGTGYGLVHDLRVRYNYQLLH